MTATNHTLTGVLVGLTVSSSVVAVPLAFLLHFVLDSLPHYGNPDHTSDKFKKILLTDALLAASILSFITIARPENWLLAAICGIACASPDLMWLPHWLRELKNKPKKPYNLIEKFHSRIQKYEKPQNYPYEVVWFVACLTLLAKAT